MFPFEVKQNENLVDMLIKTNEMSNQFSTLPNLSDEERSQADDAFANLKSILQTKIGEDAQNRIAAMLDKEAEAQKHDDLTPET